MLFLQFKLAKMASLRSLLGCKSKIGVDFARGGDQVKPSWAHSLSYAGINRIRFKGISHPIKTTDQNP
jgi:hypothetical protein